MDKEKEELELNNKSRDVSNHEYETDEDEFDLTQREESQPNILPGGSRLWTQP